MAAPKPDKPAADPAGGEDLTDLNARIADEAAAATTAEARGGSQPATPAPPTGGDVGPSR